MKKKVYEIISHHVKWISYTPIDEIENDIKKLRSLGVTHIEIGRRSGYRFFKIREENDEEHRKRIDREKRIEKVRKERELKELQRLKNKYENADNTNTQ